ncbi:MAG TPA: FHA domain-containing protein [Kofleriaceae bacterium]|nr:FHA domain-containing protein [Kofleriaceae bacterium]
MPQLRYLGAEDASEGTTSGQLPEPGQVFAVDAGRAVYLGRGVTADITVQSNRVAPVHAMVALMPESIDRLVVVDLGSTNGTVAGGEVAPTAVLSPGDVFALAGIFRFAFESESPPRVERARPTSGRTLGGILTMVLGLILFTFASCSQTWFDGPGASAIGLSSYRTCDANGDCTTESMGAIYENGPEDADRAARSETFLFLGWMVVSFGVFTWAAAASSVIQALRRRRPTAIFFVFGMISVATLAGMIMVGMVPLELDGASPTTVRFGPYLHWFGAAIAIAGAALLWSGRPPRAA